MKILIDGISLSLKSSGGINRYWLNLLPAIKKLNRTIKIELLIHTKLKLPQISRADIEINYLRKLPIPLPKTFFEPLITPLNNFSLNQQWQKISGDIFHSSYYTRHPDNKIPQVITVYDMIYEKFPQYFYGKKYDNWRERKRQSIELADAIICISKNTKKDLINYYNLKNNKVYVIYPGVDKVFKHINTKLIINRFFKKYKITRPYLLFLGPRGRYKNFQKLIEAYREWKGKREFDIITVGGNEFTSKEKLLFKRTNLTNNIYNFQFVGDQDLCLFYNCAYAFIYPSFYEGFGIPLLEAMACGTLVLASNRSSFPEASQNAFIYFNPESKNSIIKSLNQALNKSERKKYIQRGVERVKSFSWEKAARQTLTVYKSLGKP